MFIHLTCNMLLQYRVKVKNPTTLLNATYEVWPKKNKDGSEIIMVKNRHDAATFNLIRFSCSFETSSDKLQNVSQSVSVSSLETVCLTSVKC